MKQITIEIPDNKFQFVIELLSNLRYIRLKKKESNLSGEDLKYIQGLKNALSEVDDYLKGNRKLQSAKDFLNEV